MRSWRLAACGLAFGLCASPANAQPPAKPPATGARPASQPANTQATTAQPAADASASDSTYLRVFLRDGTSLVSYGEVARVGSRVVFSMPTDQANANPDLQLVDLPADRVDWDHTDKYARSARAKRYLASQAAVDYAQVSNDVARALNSIASIPDPAKRLEVAERARKQLAEWPAAHFNYKIDDVRQMLGMLDEAVADLRAAAGRSRFDLTLVSASSADATPTEPLLPTPTVKETIEGVLKAANVTDSAAERVALLSTALTAVKKSSDDLPGDWAAATVASTTAAIARERATDRAYQSFTTTTLSTAKLRAKGGDVRGLERLLDQIHERDKAMGGKRPQSVQALIDSVAAELDAARRLQLARDKWAIRAPEYKQYRAEILESLNRFAQLKAPLEDIKSLAGSSPFALARIQRADVAIRKNLAAAHPPSELQQAHALFTSAVELADSAATIRREAALTSSITRAWDASSAAAGALMLMSRASDELDALVQMPQLAQVEPAGQAQSQPAPHQ